MTDYVIEAESTVLNFSPYGFHVWAKHFYKCRQDFVPPDDAISPVPYFLLCKAIELRLKAWHLEDRRQIEVKKAYGHDLIESYGDLPDGRMMLSAEELELLTKASELYVGKAFEYVHVIDPVTAFTRWPNLAALDAIAAKIMSA